MRFFLPPGRRLRRRVEFQRVFESGHRAHGRYLTIVAAPSTGAVTRLGIVASRKIGGAVSRNRAKRLIREVFRTQPELGRSLDVVVIAKQTAVEAKLTELSRDYGSTLKRLELSNL